MSKHVYITRAVSKPETRGPHVIYIEEDSVAAANRGRTTLKLEGYDVSTVKLPLTLWSREQNHTSVNDYWTPVPGKVFW